MNSAIPHEAGRTGTHCEEMRENVNTRSVQSARHGKAVAKAALVVSAATLGVGLVGASAASAATAHSTPAASIAKPAANYWVLWDTDIPNPGACINEGKALVSNGTANTYKCTGGGVDYSLYIIPRNGGV
jgi:hypothetical protein